MQAQTNSKGSLIAKRLHVEQTLIKGMPCLLCNLPTQDLCVSVSQYASNEGIFGLYFHGYPRISNR